MVADFKSGDLMEELQERIRDELVTFLKPKLGDIEVPSVTKSRDLSKGDFVMMFAPVCARLKQNPMQYTTAIAAELEGQIAAVKSDDKLVWGCAAAGPYLNLFVNRALVFKLTIRAVTKAGGKYGHTATKAGKRAIVEHTSSNPNAPLHIGNLRNVMVGAHLGKLLEAVGYDVGCRFYVNDLGAQIGLTALGYHRNYNRIEPSMKIDQWIGSIYSIMNTFVELQKVGVDIGLFGDKVAEGEAAIEAHQAELAASAPTPEAGKLRKEYGDIFRELRDREGWEKLFQTIWDDVKSLPDIKAEGAKLNLAYERNEEWAVKIFRKMVIDCLGGVQQTLDVYGVKHDAFDFESELGWSGSNKKVMDIMRTSPYFVEPTQCNKDGVPQGGHMKMAEFIEDQKLKTGKGGYQKDYPPLYVLRPDYSTLYTFRDVVYSFKKVSEADLVLNIICSEQDLAQQKVALAMQMLNPDVVGKLYHSNYELVKLTTGKMSGRRGRYLLADDLYDQLKEVIVDKMRKRYEEKGDAITEEEFNAVTHEVSTAAMKYALLSQSAGMQINFDIAKITDFEDASAPFILYNSTRVSSLIRKFEALKEPLVPLEDVDFKLIDDKREWEMLMDFVLPFASVLKEAACPVLPPPPQLPNFHTHRVCDYLNMFVRALSGYYGPAGVRILPGTRGDGGGQQMHSRVHLCKAMKQCIDNGLRLLMIEPLEKM